ncbi:MAG TPA: very short patch repair endonuclease [Tepidisphaeraceae bacterium]|jgi:DNA mismatch endonuclease (patch repair protein)
MNSFFVSFSVRIAVDNFSTEQRSRIMSQVRQKDTKPELLVRRMIFGLGYRYRLHVRSLPGTPDIVFPARRKIVLIHGCFWHRHKAACPLTRTPKSNVEFWAEKFERNHLRDQKTRRALRRLGWTVMTIWECQTRDVEKLVDRLARFLG